VKRSSQYERERHDLRLCCGAIRSHAEVAAEWNRRHPDHPISVRNVMHGEYRAKQKLRKALAALVAA
jgi:hypothetical protein